jgi:hypothetical protein
MHVHVHVQCTCVCVCMRRAHVHMHVHVRTRVRLQAHAHAHAHAVRVHVHVHAHVHVHVDLHAHLHTVLPSEPWLEHALNNIGSNLSIDSENGEFGSRVVALVKVRSDITYEGPLTCFNRELKLQWEYLMRPSDAYSVKIIEVCPVAADVRVHLARTRQGQGRGKF